MLCDSRYAMWFTLCYVIHVMLCDSRYAIWFTLCYVIHVMLCDSRYAMWFTLCYDSRYAMLFTLCHVIHVMLCDSRYAMWFTLCYVIHVMLCDSRYAMWFTLCYVIHVMQYDISWCGMVSCDVCGITWHPIRSFFILDIVKLFGRLNWTVLSHIQLLVLWLLLHGAALDCCDLIWVVRCHR